MKVLILMLVSCLVLVVSLKAQNYTPSWESIDRRPIPSWYREAKFGIFIHWGVYSVPAFAVKGQYAEWYQHALIEKENGGKTLEYHNRTFGPNFSYYQFAPYFKAELFDPDAWARLIEQSGAKYIVLTSKHHDGFALWPSKEATKARGFAWNAVEAGPKRDLLGDLFMAIRKTTVHPGIYYSLYEWYNPLWLSNKNRYVSEHMWPQMKDVINTYKPEVFWTDGEWEASDTTFRSREFLTWMFNESPVKDFVVVNDRWGKGEVRFHHGGFYTPEYQPELDFKDHYFEESRGMGFSYGYNRVEDAQDYNSANVLVLHLLDKVSRGGNFLLDIGPDAHGKIPPIMQERLIDIGKWMKVNGEAVYGTMRWKEPFQWSAGNREYKPAKIDFRTGGDVMLKLTDDPDPGFAVREIFFTYKAGSPGTLFAISPRWPASGKLLVRNMDLSGKQVTFLETGQRLKCEKRGSDSLLSFPAYKAGEIKTAFCYVIKIKGV